MILTPYILDYFRSFRLVLIIVFEIVFKAYSRSLKFVNFIIDFLYLIRT